MLKLNTFPFINATGKAIYQQNKTIIYNMWLLNEAYNKRDYKNLIHAKP